MQVCLSTRGIAPACHENPTKAKAKEAVCPSTGLHWLLCRKCPIHIDKHAWMKVHHEPSLGYVNFKRMEEEFLQRGLSKLFIPSKDPSQADATILDRTNRKRHLSLDRDPCQAKVSILDKQGNQKVSKPQSKPHKADRQDSQSLGKMYTPTVHIIAIQKPLMALAGFGILTTIAALLSSRSTRSMP